MLKFALCDDDPEQLGLLRGMMETYIAGRPELDAQLACFSYGQSLLNHTLMHGGFDLYVLDVIMPEPSGIQIGMELRKQDEAAAILFLTASPDFAVDSYLSKASDYLLKPVKQERLFSALDDAVSRMEAKRAVCVAVKTRSQLVRIPLRLITYAELANRCVQYHLIRGEDVSGPCLRSAFRNAVAPLLADSRFAQCGASFVVNLQYVKTLGRNDAVLVNGAHVPVSRSLYMQFKSRWLDFWLEG